MIDRNSKASINQIPKSRPSSNQIYSSKNVSNNIKMSPKITQHNQYVHNQYPQNQSENAFYDTLRIYTQRLNQQRGISLTYLEKINQLSQQLRAKDLEIIRLNKLNKDLIQKLSVYESVLSRSRVRANPLRISTVIDKKNMLESMIEIVVEQPNKQSQIQKINQIPIETKFFQQFFIISPGGDQNNDPVTYRYLHYPNNNKIQESIKIYLQSPEFVLQPYQNSPIKSGSKRILFLSDSSYTTVKTQNKPWIPLVQSVNPSVYYFGFSILQKQLLNMNGKLFWVPVIYGFITYYPFPQIFLRILEIIAKDYPQTKDPIHIQQSLNNLNNIFTNSIVKKSDKTYSVELPIQFKYNLLNKLQTLIIPIQAQFDSIMLGYSKDIFDNYAIQLIIDVLLLLLLQIPITVVSQNIQLLGKFMLYFVCIIRPLKYPFPIVFSLPKSMQALLQSPFPTFIGCSDFTIVDRYINQRAVFDLDKKIAKSWPILQHLDRSRQYLMKIIQKNGGSIQKGQLIKQILTGKSNKDLQHYWKDFSKTQIYQIYTCQI